jgi:hypothetical protein
MEHAHRYKINDAHYTPRRAPIPRPWLKPKKLSGNDLDILGEPRWEFSLSKLSTCCRGKKSEENKTTRNAPFLDFPLIRRDSSSSFNSWELYSVCELMLMQNSSPHCGSATNLLVSPLRVTVLGRFRISPIAILPLLTPRHAMNRRDDHQ